MRATFKRTFASFSYRPRFGKDRVLLVGKCFRAAVVEIDGKHEQVRYIGYFKRQDAAELALDSHYPALRYVWQAH